MGEKKSSGSIEISKVDDGIRIYVKNPKLEAFFKQASGGALTKSALNRDDQPEQYLSFYKIGGPQCDRFSVPFSFKDVGLKAVLGVGDAGRLFDQNGNVFVWWLRAVGIGDGKEFIMKGAYTIKELKQLEHALKEFISTIFKEYMTPYMSKILFTVQEFTTEEFVNANKQEVMV